MINYGRFAKEVDPAGPIGWRLAVWGVCLLGAGIALTFAVSITQDHGSASHHGPNPWDLVFCLPIWIGLVLETLAVLLGLAGVAGMRRGNLQKQAWMSLALGAACWGGLFVWDALAPEDRRRTMAEIKSNGKNMYTAVFADAVDAHAVGFPRSDAHSNATDYVLALAAGETRIVPAGPDYFSCPGMRSAESWEAFGPEHCGWSFVADLDESTPAGIPFAISSNVRGDTLADLRGRIGDTIDPGHPMGTRFVVVAYHGGQSRILTRRDKWEEALIDLGEFADQPILRP